MMETAFIINPHSAAGKTSRLWEALTPSIERWFPNSSYLFTSAPKDATQLARTAALGGVKTIFSMGGDGTHSEVINGLFENEQPINPDLTVGFLPMGTGSDFIRSLKLPRHPLTALEELRRSQPIHADIGHVRYTAFDGSLKERVFLNILSFGLTAMAAHFVNQSSKKLGVVSFLLGGARAIWRLAANPVLVNDRQMHSLFCGPTTLVAIANGQYFGGGLRVSPRSRLNDGILDLVVIEHLNKFALLCNFPKLYRGSHIDKRWVHVHPHNYIHVTPQNDEPILVEADGEVIGQLPLTVTCLPRTLKVLAGPSF